MRTACVLALAGAAVVMIAGCQDRTKPAYLPRPEHVIVRSGTTLLRVSWSPVAEAGGYTTYVAARPSVSPDDYDIREIIGAGQGETKNIRNLTPGVEYWVVVTASRGDAVSRPSPALSMRTLTPGSPITPMRLWTITEGSNQFGEVIASGGDVNDDGFIDLLVGAPNVSNDEGRVFLFTGSSGVPDTTPVWSFDGPNANSKFGAAMTSIDANNDSYGDIVVAAPEEVSSVGGLALAGRVRVFHGGPAGPSPNIALEVSGTETNGAFGASVATGDFGGAGTDDLLAGAPGADVAVILAGPSLSGPGWVASGANDQQGVVVAAASFDNGVVDAAVAAPGGDVVRVYHDVDIGVSTTPTVELAVAGLSQGKVALATGDIDNDSFNDLVVAAPADGAGRVTVFFGGSTALTQNRSMPLTGDTADTDFGSALAVGDVNGDDFDDVIVGQRPNDEIYVFAGSAAGVTNTKLATITGAQAGMQLGDSVIAYDMNGDGGDEIVVSDGPIRMVAMFAGETTLGPRADVTAVAAPAGETSRLDVVDYLPPFFGDRNCIVEWGDGGIDPLLCSELHGVTHTYETAGRYEVRISLSAPNGATTRIVTPMRVPD